MQGGLTENDFIAQQVRSRASAHVDRLSMQPRHDLHLIIIGAQFERAYHRNRAVPLS